jgi:hypothetical protein
MKQFICKVEGSNYYLVNESMGSFLNPPNHATYNYSIREYRGGHESGGFSLEFGANKENSYVPSKVRIVCKNLLKKYPGEIDNPDWIEEVYKYFHNCYSKDGIDRSASNCIVCKNESDKEFFNPEFHLGYLFVKSFNPNHEIRIDLI